MDTINVVGYIFLFYILFRLLIGKQWMRIFVPSVKREQFKPMRFAYHRAHKIIRRRIRPYNERLRKWLVPYKRMLL